VTEQAERYDQIAEGYARWWAPVLAPGVARLLDRAAPWVGDGAVRVIDIGTGTGQLAFEAIRRWPRLTVVGVDASAGMRAMADELADEALGPERDRFTTDVAFADRLPFDDRSFDVAISSFVFQLVPNRARALREARRVLRPGGVLAYVSWLQDRRPFRPDQIYDEVLETLDIGGPEPAGHPGDIPSVQRAAGELRRAGFADVQADAEDLEHRYTPDGYISFLSEFDEQSLFEELEPDEREYLESTLRRRLAELSAEEMTMRSSIVFASGRRSR
jgi:ubiquinone/menaquinone biosynthesis C-methylase UbiE